MSKLYELTGAFLEVLSMLEDEECDEQCIMDTLESIEYEIEDMEKAVLENFDMHLNFTKDVMDIMTFIRNEWGMHYPEEEGREIL